MMMHQRKLGTNKGRGKRVRDGDKWKVEEDCRNHEKKQWKK